MLDLPQKIIPASFFTFMKLSRHILPLTATVLTGVGTARVTLAHQFSAQCTLHIFISAPLSFILLMTADYIHFRTRINFGILLCPFLLMVALDARFSAAFGLMLGCLWIYNTWIWHLRFH
jgi:hypothetical protein